MVAAIAKEPHLGLATTFEDTLEGQRQTATMVVFGPVVLSTGILYHLTDGAASAWHIPHAAHQLVDEYGATMTSLSSLLLEGSLALVNLGKEAVGHLGTSIEQAIETHPLGTGQGRRLHILGTLDEGDVEFLDLAIASAVLKG